MAARGRWKAEGDIVCDLLPAPRVDREVTEAQAGEDGRRGGAVAASMGWLDRGGLDVSRVQDNGHRRARLLGYPAPRLALLHSAIRRLAAIALIARRRHLRCAWQGSRQNSAAAVSFHTRLVTQKWSQP